MKRIEIILWLIFFNPLFIVEAKYHAPPKLTEEQQAINRENQLRRTELKIGTNCEIKSIATSLYIKTLNSDDLKKFWLGQRYAVERTYRDQVEAIRLGAMNNMYDNQIAAIEQRRTEANLSAVGIKPYRSADFDRANAEANSLLSRIDADIARSNREWFDRCYRYADDRSK